MFKTINSKILMILILTLSTLIFVFFIFSCLYFKNSREIFIDANYLSISSLAQKINNDITKIEVKAQSMAAFGEIFYNSARKQTVIDEYVLKTILDYGVDISGGIWYKPYVINPDKKHFYSFAYLDKQGNAVLNHEYGSDENDYLKSNWYNQLIKDLESNHIIAWSTPYYEENGIQAHMITAGVGIYDKDNLVGLSTVDWGFQSIMEDVSKIKPTPNSFSLLADISNDFVLVSTDKYIDNDEIFGKSLKNIPWYDNESKNKSRFKYQNKYYIQYISILNNGMTLIVNVPESEMYMLAIFRFFAMLAILLFFSMTLCLSIYLALNKNIVQPINKLMDIAKKIGKGETELSIKIDNPVEFKELAETYDKMTKDLKKIMAKQAVIDYELNIAKSIQITSLPRIFPPYPEKTEFDIFASMTPAKEVGGDFYDFYFVGPEDFMFLVADVSGKGIPASLFMMKVKTLINNVSQTSCSPQELVEIINKKVCENNDEDFFVTLFACIVNIKTGKASCINCGHNPPLIKHKDGQYDFMKPPSNIVLGAFEDAKYEIFDLNLSSGDRIFLYTDGIIESFNQNDEMFGEQRLKIALNENTDLSLNETLSNVRKNVDNFADGNEQSDDITMVIFDFKGDSNKKVFKEMADIKNYKAFYELLYETFNGWNIKQELIDKILMCAEEIYSNITFYAYPDLKGEIEVRIALKNDKIILTFIDEGIKYNPLEKKDPDITLPVEEKEVGGLGIYMVKNLADNILYKRVNNKNVLTLKFNLLS